MLVTEVLKTATRLVVCSVCVCCWRHHALEDLHSCILLLSPHFPLFARYPRKIAKEHRAENISSVTLFGLLCDALMFY